MRNIIKYFIRELDYHNEFTTEEAVVYTVLAIAVFVFAACGESIILNIF